MTLGLFETLDEFMSGASDPKRAVTENAYLKSPLRHYGASMPVIRRAVKTVRGSTEGLTHAELLDLVSCLWAGPVHDQRMAGVVLLEEYRNSLEPADLPMLENMIRGSFTWAYVDGLAANVAGPLVERHPELTAQLDHWANDKNFWVRRAAMLALLLPLRNGEGDWDRFTRYADGMLDDKEFFIRKAIGWVLRETAKKRPEMVRDYVGARIDRFASLTFREAVKRLPEQDQKILRRAYEAAR